MNRSLFAIVLSAPLCIVACDQKPATVSGAPASATAHAHESQEHTEEVALGSQKTGAMEVSAVIGKGWEKAGEAHVEVKLVGPAHAVVRAWIGSKEGIGSVKAKLGEEGDHFHGHVEVASSVPLDAKLWVEVENAAAVGFDLGASR